MCIQGTVFEFEKWQGFTIVNSKPLIYLKIDLRKYLAQTKINIINIIRNFSRHIPLYCSDEQVVSSVFYSVRRAASPPPPSHYNLFN